MVSQLPVHGRPALSFRLLRRRHALLSQRQAVDIAGRPVAANIGWDKAEEVTFECEPGTLSEPKFKRSAKSA